MLKKKIAIPTLFAGALALGALGTAPQQAQAASKTENFILGLAAGVATTAIIASAARAHKKKRKWRERYYRDRYYRSRTAYRYRPRPWTPEWYDYCMSKYRSFNPETGYFLSYSGRYKFCR